MRNARQVNITKIDDAVMKATIVKSAVEFSRTSRRNMRKSSE